MVQLKNFSSFSLLAYTVHYRLCDYGLHKLKIDTDIDILHARTSWN